MSTQFELNQEQLLNIVADLKKKILAGLQKTDQEIQCIPTFIPVHEGQQEGRALVIDFGGTNVRAAVVSLKDGEMIMEKGPVMQAIPMERGVPLANEKFLQSFVDLIASLDPPQDLPLGYCFSYPTGSTPDGDAELLRWTKGVSVENTVGHKVGKQLLDALAAHSSPVRCSKVAVINDTIASQLAGLTATDADTYIGLIVGTGNNMAALMDAEQVSKIPKELKWKGLIPINLESGNFTPPYLTSYDDRLDQESDNAGHQRFEKSVSGVYLAKLLKLAHPDSDIKVEVGSKAVVKKAYAPKPSDLDEQKLAKQILTRSAKLVAASLAALVTVMSATHERHHVCVAAEGGLFWGDPEYKNTTQHTLETLLDALGMPDVTVEFFSLPNANLLGSAVAALS